MGASTKLTRLYARAPRGVRAIGSTPHGHWKTSTFVAGLTSTGFIAPLVLDGPMNGRAFLAYTQQFLAPALREGDILVMDNLAAHKTTGVRETVAARGASVLYLPPYSPDLNPIEMAFAKLKALLRAAEPRTIDALWRAIGNLLDRFTPAQCRNMLRHAGYPRSG